LAGDETLVAGAPGAQHISPRRRSWRSSRAWKRSAD